MNTSLPSAAGRPEADTDPYAQTAYDHAVETSGPTGSAISMEEIRSVIWRQRRLVIIIVATALLLGVIFTLLITPLFRATATVRIEANSAAIFDQQSLEPGVDWRFLDRYIETLGSVMQSRKLAQRVDEKLDLSGNDEFFAAMGLDKGDLDFGKNPTEARRNLAISLLSGSISLEGERNSNIAKIQFVSEDPGFAMRIANAYADAFVEANATRTTEVNAYARDVVDQQISETRSQLADAERQSLAYSRDNRIIDPTTGTQQGMASSESPGSSLIASNLVSTNQQYIDARNRRILAEQRWNSARKGNALSLPEAQSNTAIQTLLGEQARLRGELSELRGRYLPDHPEIVEREKQLASIENDISEATASLRQSIQREYQVAQAQEQQLAQSREALADQTLDEQSRRVQLGILSRQVDSLRYRLTKLLDRQGELESSSDASPTNIEVLDHAQRPSAPYSPEIFKNLAVALVLGAIVAMAFAILREIIDDTIYSPDVASRKLGHPVLGLVPYAEDTGDFDEVHSEIGEAYSSLRVAVDAATGGLRSRKSILITSSRPGEGKTTSARLIARDYARIGRRVLLIDADMRNPSLHRAMGAANKRGLINVLTEDIPLTDVLLPAAYPGLDVLPSGPTPPNAAQLLSTTAFSEFLDRASNDYNVIIIDAPPVMGLADAPVLARASDYTLFIAEAGKARLSAVKKAIARLELPGARVVGLSINKFDEMKAGYGYGYGYEYYQYRSEGTAS